jgi:hypothetical protein
MNDKENVSSTETKPPTAFYLIKGISFKQDQLEYGQAQELLKIPSIEKVKGLNLDGGITSMLAEVLKSDIARDVVNLVLKPNNKNLWLKVKNYYYSKKNKVDKSDIAKHLQLWEVKKVLQDFFYFNVTLMLSATGSELISGLTKMISQQQIYSTPSEPKKEGLDL